MLGMRVDYELEDSPLDVTGIQNVALGAEKCIVFVSGKYWLWRRCLLKMVLTTFTFFS